MSKISKFHLQELKKTILSPLFCTPTSLLLALTTLLLLLCNALSVFFYIPFPANPSPPADSVGFSPEKFSGKVSSSVMYNAVQEDRPLVTLASTHLAVVDNRAVLKVPTNRSSVLRPRKGRKRRALLRILGSREKLKGSRRFRSRIREFFGGSGCKVRFFMTWISSLESFGGRELFAIESLFKAHRNACLVIVSNSMDSKRGSLVLSPFVQNGFKVIALKPDFDYIFKGTHGESWFRKLKRGNVDPGEFSLGQNLSNLLRLGLLYRFGGVYIDTDVIVLKSFSTLRNCIGAQTNDLITRKWSRLNNAVLVFDKNHPLLFKFIEDFALTFDGNKWGHNGPYLVSRVVSRVCSRPGFSNFTILPPSAFYPVDWSRIRGLFRGPKGHLHSKWLRRKLGQIRRESLAVHLWNKQSSKIEVENGSIINHLMVDTCIFCNSSKLLS